jgi:hypothetical protein
MPYAPGVQDISGQLIAQGMSQAGAARARAIESLGESISGGIRQYQQNQLVTNQALGKFGSTLQSNPSFKTYVDSIISDQPNAPQVPEPLKKAFQNAAKGKVDIYDAALLGTAAEGFQQSQQNQMQRMAQMANINKANAEAYAQMLQSNAMAEAMRMQGMNVPQPAVQQMPEGMGQFMGQPQAGAPAVPASVRTFADAPQSLADRPIPEGLDPNLWRTAVSESLMGVATGKGYSAPMLNYNRLQQARIGARKEESLMNTIMTADEAEDLVTRKNEAEREKPFAQRMLYTREPHPTGQGYVIKQQPAQKTAAETVSEARDVEQEKGRIQDIQKRIEDARAEAATIADVQDAARQLRQLYQAGELTGDALANAKATAASYAKAFGLNLGKDVDQAQSSAQLGQAMMNRLIIPLMSKFKGATSDRDVVLMKTFYPSIQTNPKAAIAMLDLLERRLNYQRQLDDIGAEWSARRIDASEYVDQTRKLRTEFLSQIPTISDFSKSIGAAPTTKGLTQEEAAKVPNGKFRKGPDGLWYPYSSGAGK